MAPSLHLAASPSQIPDQNRQQTVRQRSFQHDNRHSPTSNSSRGGAERRPAGLLSDCDHLAEAERGTYCTIHSCLHPAGAACRRHSRRRTPTVPPPPCNSLACRSPAAVSPLNQSRRLSPASQSQAKGRSSPICRPQFVSSPTSPRSTCPTTASPSSHRQSRICRDCSSCCWLATTWAPCHQKWAP